MNVNTEIKQSSGLDVINSCYFSSGNNASLYRIELADGTTAVAKIAGGKAGENLDIEGYMLKYLAEHSDLPVPKVLYSSAKLLIMGYITNEGGLNRSAEIHAAEVLAALHNITSEKYGLEKGTLIGSLHQPNKQNSDWIDFFAEQRIEYMARCALDEGRITPALMKLIERLITKLPELIDQPARPSLIHGDMWGGNVLTNNGRIAGFIDPSNSTVRQLFLC